MATSRIIIFLAIILVVTTRQITEGETLAHSLFDFFGYLLIVACGMGRLYTTAYLGGYKNKELITHGPFSVVRNPLYVCSWLGFTGFALFSNNLWVILLVPVSFLALYHALIRREEVFLEEAFGDKYKNYCKNTPRFFPNFSKFKQPPELVLTSHAFLKGLLDNIWWFIIPPVFELIEMFEYF